jgi:hypothetical protein
LQTWNTTWLEEGFTWSTRQAGKQISSSEKDGVMEAFKENQREEDLDGVSVLDPGQEMRSLQQKEETPVFKFRHPTALARTTWIRRMVSLRLQATH